MSFGNPIQLYFFWKSSFIVVAGLRPVILFDTVALPAKIGIFKRWDIHVTKLCRQFTCVTCSLPVKTRKLAYFYLASTYAKNKQPYVKKHAICNLWVTSPSRTNLTYLHFAGDTNRGVIAVLPAVVGIFACNCCFSCQQLLEFSPAMADTLACNCDCFCLQLRVFLPAISGIFAYNSGYLCLQLRAFLSAFCGIFACNCQYFCLILQLNLPIVDCVRVDRMRQYSKHRHKWGTFTHDPFLILFCVKKKIWYFFC